MKYLLSAIAGLVFLVVLAVLVGPSLVDWTRFKPQIQEAVSDATGLAVTIDGPVDFDMLPAPRLLAAQVRIGAPADLAAAAGASAPGSAPGSADGEVVRLARLDLRVRLLPLLRGRIEVERATIVDPVVRARLTGAGDLVVTEGGAPAVAVGEALRGAVAIERLTIENGLLTVDTPNGETVRVTSIFGRLSAESLDGPFEVVGSFATATQAFTLEMTTGRISPTSGALTTELRVGLDGVIAELAFRGLLAPDRRATGRMTVRIGDMARLIAAVPTLADTLPPVPPDGATIEGDVQVSADGMRLTDITAEYGDLRARASLSLDTVTPLSGSLAVDIGRVDLSRWREAAAVAGALPPVDAALAWIASPDSRLGFARTTELDLALTVDAVAAGGALVRDLRVDGRLGDGVVSLDRIMAALPGNADLSAVATVRDGEAGPPVVDATVEAAAGDLRAFLGWVGLDVEAIPPTRLRSFNGRGAFRGTVGEFQIAGLEARVDNTALTGGLAYRNRGRVGLGLRLDVDRLDLDAYLPPQLDRRLDNLAALAEALAAHRPLVRRFDANFDVRVDSLTVADTAVRDLRLDATMQGGAVTLRTLSGRMLADTDIRLSGTFPQLLPPRIAEATVSVDTDSLAAMLRSLDVIVPSVEQPVGAVMATLRVAADPDTARHRVHLSAEGAGGSLQASGTATGLLPETDPEPMLAMAARLTLPTPERLTHLLPDAIRPLLPRVDTDLYARLRIADGVVTAEDLQGTVGTVPLAGEVTLETGRSPNLVGNLRTGALDLAAILPSAERARTARLGGGAVWTPIRVPNLSLPALRASVDLTSERVTLGRLSVDRPAWQIRLADGRFSVPRLSGTALDGTLSASMTADLPVAPGSLPAVDLALDLVDADMALALDTLFRSDGLTGRFDFGLDVAGRGRSLEQVAGDLSGRGLLSVQDGRMADLDLDQVVGALDRVDDPLQFLEVLRTALRAGETAFATVNAPFDVAGGVADLHAVRIVTDVGVGEGRGTLDLERLRLDLPLLFDLYAHADAPGFGIRLVGPLRSPERRLQTQALQAYVAQRVAEDLADRFLPDVAPTPTPLEPTPSEPTPLEQTPSEQTPPEPTPTTPDPTPAPANTGAPDPAGDGGIDIAPDPASAPGPVQSEAPPPAEPPADPVSRAAE